MSFLPSPVDPTHKYVLNFYETLRDLTGEVLSMTPSELEEALPMKLEAIRAECTLLEDRVRRDMPQEVGR